MSYRFQHSVEVGVSKQFAWRFWTNVDNWIFDAAIESVNLDGSFALGAKGTTKTKGGDTVLWEIVEVGEGKGAVIEIPMPGAVARFTWKFEKSNAAKTRLTQEITLAGEQAEVYAGQMREGFEQGIREGMEKLAAEMERAGGSSEQ